MGPKAKKSKAVKAKEQKERMRQRREKTKQNKESLELNTRNFTELNTRNFAIHNTTELDTRNIAMHNTTELDTINNAMHNTTELDTTHNAMHNTELDTTNNAMQNTTELDTTNNAMHNTTELDTTNNAMHNTTELDTINNAMHNTTELDTRNIAMHNTTELDTRNIAMHNTTELDTRNTKTDTRNLTELDTRNLTEIDARNLTEIDTRSFTMHNTAELDTRKLTVQNDSEKNTGKFALKNDSGEKNRKFTVPNFTKQNSKSSTDENINNNGNGSYILKNTFSFNTFRNTTPDDIQMISNKYKKMGVRKVDEPINQVCLNSLSLESNHKLLTIQGSFHQGDDIFGTNAGKQCVANSLAAVVHSKLKPIEQWDSAYLDNVLIQGNEIYNWIHGNHEELLVSELPEMIEMSDVVVKCIRKESIGAVIDGSGIIDFDSFGNALPLDQALQEALIDADGCFVCVMGSTCIAIKHRGNLYLFDSHARNVFGLQDGCGKSVVIELQDINHLYYHFCNFVQQNDNVEFEITGIKIAVEDAVVELTNDSDTAYCDPCVDTEMDHDPITVNPIEELSNDINDNILDQYTSDIEELGYITPQGYDFKPLDNLTKRKLCSVLKIPSKHVIKKSNILPVHKMGRPLQIKGISGDGNCLFRAISYAVSQRQEYHMQVRKVIVNHCLSNAKQFHSFVAPKTVEEHIQSTRMTDNSVWGTELEIIGAADFLKTDIFIYGNGNWIKYSACQVSSCNKVNDQAIYLKQSCNHYEVVLAVKKISDTESSGEYVLSGKKRKSESKYSRKSKKLKLDMNLTKMSFKDQECTKHEHMNQRLYDHSLQQAKFIKHIVLDGQTCKEFYFGNKDKLYKERERYHTNPTFKTRKLLQCKVKYHSDKQYRQLKSLKSKQKYRRDANFKFCRKMASKQKYAEDEKYRKKLKKSSINKYKNVAEHREQMIKDNQNKYKSEVYRQSKLKASKKKYASNVEFKMNVKNASKKKYATNREHKETVRNFSRNKYATNREHKQTVRNFSRNKYANNEKHKETVKNFSRNKYATNKEHKENVKNFSRNKYATDKDHKQKIKEQTIERRKRAKEECKQIDKVIEKFRSETKKGPDCVCACCFRLFFQSQVIACKKELYANKSEQVKYISESCISEKYLHICNVACTLDCKYSGSSRTNLWICYTCHRKILNGKIPAESFANKLELEDVPKELECLNSLEQHLVSLHIPFMKVLALPKGGQKGVHGPVVCVPSDLNKVTSSLPRCENEDSLLRVKLKRKLCYKGYEEYQFVSAKHLEVALKFLQEKNIWYSNINISNEWLNPIPESTDIDLNTNMEHSHFCNSRDVQVNKGTEEHDEIDIQKDRYTYEGSTQGTTYSRNNNNDKEKGIAQADDEDDTYLDDGLRGIQLDTCLQPADIGQDVLDRSFDQVFNISPAEGNTPVSVLKEDGIEGKSFPVHYPSGKNTLNEEREDKLSLLRYFNLRLLSVENRFARDTSYIFFCQYLSELDRVISNVQISLRKESPYSTDGKKLTSSMLCNKELLKDLFKKDQAIKYLKPVRGTPPYWQATQKDIFAMIRQLGMPTFFCSFSSADFRWSEIVETILRQQGDTRKAENLDWKEKCKVLCSNPVTMARMFERRFHTFLQEVILSDAEPIGKIIDYFYRVEFQQRGSPHTHCLFWVEGSPKFGEDSDEAVVNFIDKYITCEIPEETDDPELHEIVTTVHQHSKKHSKTCKKKGTVCRFNFPRPPSTRTFISKPSELEENDEECSKQMLAKLWNCILDGENEAMSTNDLFEKVGMTQTEFEKYLCLATKRNTVYLKRKVNEIYTNQYNKHLLRCWNANTDIQFVLDAYSCVVYIISYISKAERELGLLLQQTKVEAQEGNLNAQETMRKIGTAYLHHREISAQEAVFRVTGLKLKECSRKVEFIPVGNNPCRMSVPLTQLEKKNKNALKKGECNDEDDSIWMTSIIDRYKERPRNETFEKMCLASFCSEYSLLANSQIPQKINNETTFKLGNNLGYIRKRTRTSPAVIRYPRFSADASPENYFQSILQLFLPYRQDEQLKPKQFENYESFYQTGFVKFSTDSELLSVKCIVDTNRSDFVKNEKTLEEAEKDFELRGFPEDAWGCLFPGTEIERHECIEEGSVSTVVEEEQNEIAIPDLHKLDKSPATNLLSTSIQKNEAVPLLRALNKKQRRVFYKLRNWCLRKANGQATEPFYVFITGGGGTGKSHLIKCLYYEATRLLARTTDNPDDITVLLTAPTGTAAFNINGLTLHSSLSIFKSLSADHAILSEEKINTLRSKLESLQILIVDEVSMVNKRLLFFIHERLRQVKKMPENNLFGGVSIIAVGDFYQLPPVKTRKSDKLYVNDPSSPANHLWNGLFEIVQLEEIMRQRNDCTFAEMLNRLRVKKRNEAIEQSDLQTLKQCMTEGPDEALHIFSTNAEVQSYNNEMVMKINSEPKLLEAEDFEKNKTTGKLVKRKSNFSDGDIFLPTSILLAEGARVMLTKNIDTQDGLVNGVMGTVISISESTPKSLPERIYIHFDNNKVGKTAKLQKCINGKKCVALEPCLEDVPNKNGSRKQYPLQLAWACTVHKVQGLTVEECVVDLKKCFSYGQSYVALSRVTSMNGLHINEIDESTLNSKIYCDPDVADGLSTMKSFLIEEHVEKDNLITIMYHNIQGLQNHLEDLQSNPDFRGVNYICLTETWLNSVSNIELKDNQFRHLPRSAAFDSSSEFYASLKEMQHGGVGFFCKTDNTFQEMNVSCYNLECISFKIPDVNVIVATVYRTSRYHIATFIENLDSFLEQLSVLSDKIIIVGDFNQDIFKGETVLEKFMKSKGFNQYVDCATTELGTLIDHVYIKGCSDVKVTVVPTYYSYHDAVSIKLNPALI